MKQPIKPKVKLGGSTTQTLNSQNPQLTQTAVLRIELPAKFVELFTGPARYRVAYGGRGSGKTRSFAMMAALRALQLAGDGQSGLIVCAREHLNSLANSMQAELVALIRSQPYLDAQFEISERMIRTKNGEIQFSFVGLGRNLQSIKSMAKIHIFWVDEAQTITEAAWLQIIPTVREADSEIWVSWNPTARNSAVERRFRGKLAEQLGIKSCEINWRDNPWFPEVLNQERLRDLQLQPQYYQHIWEGEFIPAFVGAYYADCLAKARTEGRIGFFVREPLLGIKSFWDIGGTGARADSTAIWIAQFCGEQIRILDYYEAQGQPLATHIAWLRAQNYELAQIYLPHDGRTMDKVFEVSFESSLQHAGFNVEVVPNQGAGAARARIETARRIFPRCYFNAETTKAGIDVLAWYHEKRDESRDIGLGPEHDWSSHGADAFGLLALVAQQENRQANSSQRYNFAKIAGSWMSA